MRVVGIDAGYINFAVCSVDASDTRRPIYWKNEPLFTGTFSEEKLVDAVYKWVTRPDIQSLLEGADMIVLERQMMKRFQAVNHCIRFRYFEKTREINPNTLGKYFNLPIDRKSKKKATVDLVSKNLPLPVKTGKKDDLADAYLLAMYEIFERFPAQKNNWIEGDAKTQPDKRKARAPKAVLVPTKRRRHKEPTVSKTRVGTSASGLGEPWGINGFFS